MKKLMLLVVLLTLVAFVSGVMAQEKAKTAPPKPAAAPAPKLEKFSGVIDKVDEMAKVVVVKGKVKKEEKTLTFAIDDKTKITKAGKDMPFSDLKAGMNVAVGYKKEGDKNIAATIKVAAPKAAPKEKKK
jgi:Cu/Ag efflux protein CusF